MRSRDSLLEWIRAVQRGRCVFIGKEYVANCVYAGDVVEALVRLSEGFSPGGEIAHVADPAPMAESMAAMTDALGVGMVKRTVPVWAAYALAAGVEAANRVLGTPAPLARARVSALSSTCRFSGDVLRTREGIRLPFGYRGGLARTVRWYRATGRL